MLPVTGWYAVALGAGLETGTAIGTHLFDREIALWRDGAGTAHAWEDRCPHRGMRLSLGFVRGDRLACLYHGWQYDAEGRCRHIPAHPSLTPPSTTRTVRYACRERLGFVWVRLAAPEDDAPVLPDDTTTVPVRSLAIDCSAETALDGLMAARWPIFARADGDAAVGHAAQRSGALVTIAADAGSGAREMLLAAVQPRGPSRTTIHLAVAAGDRDYRGAGQAQIARWAITLREALERAAAGREHAA